MTTNYCDNFTQDGKASPGNIRHELDAERVAQQIRSRIEVLEKDRLHLKEAALRARAAYEAAQREGTSHQWGNPPKDPDWVDNCINDRILLEKDYYARVRVIELAKGGARFVLAYGDVSDAEVTSGTGPFGTLAEAENWFYRSGR